MKDINLDSLVRIIILSANHLTFIQDAIHLAEINRNVPSDKSLHHTGDNLVLLIIIIREQALSLSLTDLLQDYVLRVLNSDAAKRSGVDVNIHLVSKLIGTVDHLRIRKTDLRHAILDAFNHILRKKNSERLLLLIKRYHDIRQIRAVEVISASLLQRFRDRVKQHLALDVFFFLKDYESVKQFVVHFLFLFLLQSFCTVPYQSKASRIKARSFLRNESVRPSSVSMVTLSLFHCFRIPLNSFSCSKL